MATLLLSVTGAFAEFERALILERQREGIAAAKQRGAYTGRRPALTATQADQLRQLPDIQAYGNLRLRDLAQRGPASARAMWGTARDALTQQYGNVTVAELLAEFEGLKS